VHAALNTTALSLYLASLIARARGRRRGGQALAPAVLGVLLGGGYLGGAQSAMAASPARGDTRLALCLALAEALALWPSLPFALLPAAIWWAQQGSNLWLLACKAEYGAEYAQLSGSAHAPELRKPCREMPQGAWESLHGGSRKWFPEQFC
jgi:hypothetical protein